MGHEPVMLSEVCELLAVKPGGVYVDGTVGGGGHASAILKLSSPDGYLAGFDRDAMAIRRVRESLSREFDGRFVLFNNDFARMDRVLADAGIGAVDGILLDLGVSSYQLDEAERGFSFMKDGPLDMRMDRDGSGPSAADVVNGLGESELAGIIWRYGEERKSRRIARRIALEREKGPILSTLRLAEVVSAALGGRRGRTHPATRTFQALRIHVNGELDSLKRGLECGVRLLKPGGRMAVISFHSLEDREVKIFFRDFTSSAAGGISIRRVTRKPVMAGDDEVGANPRARSARLRVIEKD